MRNDSDIFEFVRENRALLAEWHSPTEAIELVEGIISSIEENFSGRLDFLHDSAASPFREMWVLARCVKLLGRSHVRLSLNEPRPDGYSRHGGAEFGAEVTETIEPGRKRRLEYSTLEKNSWRFDPGDQWVRRADLIPQALAETLRKKKAIKYPPNTELFVYLNIGEYGIRQTGIEAEIQSQLSQPQKPFADIFVRWKEKLYGSDGRVWSEEALGMV